MLKLVQTDVGQFELALITPEDNLDQVALETLIYAVLFTDQQAPADRVADPFDLRGWWYDPARGTGLWYVRRQALSPAARREALNMVKRAIEAKSEAFSDVIVLDITDAGNVSRVNLDIQGLHNGIKFTMKALL